MVYVIKQQLLTLLKLLINLSHWKTWLTSVKVQINIPATTSINVLFYKKPYRSYHRMCLQHIPQHNYKNIESVHPSINCPYTDLGWITQKNSISHITICSTFGSTFCVSPIETITMMFTIVSCGC